MEEDEQRGEDRRNDSLTRWTVGAVLALLLAVVFASASFAFTQLMDNTRRITVLERELAATNAATAVRLDGMLSSLARIEADLKEHRTEASAARARR